MTELEAARFVRAALELIRDNVPDGGNTMAHVLGFLEETESQLRELERVPEVTPPWEPEPAESVELTWSEVIPGDSVLAPNGTWYPVDSVSPLVLVGPTGAKIKSTPRAEDKVTVRRGPAGLAVDVFRAGGLELEVIGS